MGAKVSLRARWSRLPGQREGEEEEEDDAPHERANALSRAVWGWLDPLLSTGERRQLNEADLTPVARGDRPRATLKRFEGAYARRRGGAYRIWRALLAAERRQLALAAAFKVVNDSSLVLGPLVLRALTREIEGDPPEVPGVSARARGYVLAALLVVASLAKTLAVSQYFHFGYKAAMNIKSSLLGAAFSKSLRVAKGTFSHSHGHTIIGGDLPRILEAIPYLHMLWSGPYQIAICVALLHKILGHAFWPGLGVIVLFVAANLTVSGVYARWQRRLLAEKDTRVSRVSEVVQGIKLIKSSAWEESFTKRVKEARKPELQWLFGNVIMEMTVGVLWEACPLVVAAFAFMAFIAMGGQLKASVVFPALAVFDILRWPLIVFPEVMMKISGATAALRRIADFLDAKEISAHTREGSASPESYASVEVHGSFASASDGATVLRRIDLSASSGRFVAVVGKTGSGKTSLLEACLGELEPVGDTSIARLRGKVAYVSQKPFLLNDTVQENICFGTGWDERRYEEALFAAALEEDIEQLPSGDKTEIGAGSTVNLSGGQQTRITLARAIYVGAEIVLLDDPLSALDAKVAQSVFQRAILGSLQGRTVLMATHLVSFAAKADEVLVMSKGEICERGHYSSMLETDGSAMNQLMQRSRPSKPSSRAKRESREGAMKRQQSGISRKDSSASVTQVERREAGRSGWAVYSWYLRASGMGIWVAIMCLFVLWTGIFAGIKYWLSVWSEKGGRWDAAFATVYFSLIGAAIAVLSVRQYLRTVGQCRGAQVLHERLLESVLRAPLTFFVRTPKGRLLNRFTSDMTVIEESLHDDMGDFLRNFCSAAGVIIVVSITVPVVLLLLPLELAVFYFIQRRYIRSATELRRLYSVSNSPIYSLFGEALAGAPTIRAYGREDDFRAKFEGKLDQNMRAYWLRQAANRWLTVRTETLGALIIGATALGIVLELDAGSGSNAGLAGLALSYALSLTESISWTIRVMSEVETQIVSAERVKEYTELESEPPLVEANARPYEGWPPFGQIAMRDIWMRYRSDLPWVLRGINLQIEGKEKVGLVGRTGSGKSSLQLALLRLADQKHLRGAIFIDGLNIFQIGVGDLRRHIATVTQEPVVFGGTIRFNLDPLEAKADEELWRALDLVGLRKGIAAKATGLDGRLGEAGKDWSVGECQLLCLARTMLRECAIVILDESTSSVDDETDRKMQSAIRLAFSRATLITIAHRLDTIMDGDRVVVLERGAVVEEGSPHALAADEESTFHSLRKEFAPGCEGGE